ncbi:MAG: DUF2723 domain-containing protein [Bacteroidia bacterium]|nr:DUF2723 domain-containing protein [Bacteroidia bacterium]
MDFKRLNNLTGWAVFAIAMVSYLMTMAPTASFWDCGEFIACANELEVPHPPGAPFFLLLGRIFAMFAFDVEQIAYMLNLLSGLSSAFTVLFTFWITTHLAAKLVGPRGTKFSNAETIAILASGVVAGLANAYADSFWFNAVEAEVYAMSSFFTAVVVWVMFKWEERADEPGNLRYLILIAYIMGLSIGVHLLNLLTIPALAFIYYFRKYDFSWKGFFITGGISVGILGIIQTGIILNTFDLAWAFERFFTDVQSTSGKDISGLGLPIGSGVVIFFTLLFGAMAYAIYWSQKTARVSLNTALISTLVIYIGFSSYLMIPIRSQANPPIDENNPENTQSFLSYMKREQYGSRPLLKGPLYNARPTDLEEAGNEYMLAEDGQTYIELGVKRQYKYAEKDMKFFPRMYDNTRPLSWDPRQGPYTYANFVQRTGAADDPYDDKPTNGEDMAYFFKYQIGHMYMRYFLWNFVGKEGDFQDAGWESGFDVSKQAKMPDFIKNHPAKNHFFFLPLLLGMLGLAWQSTKRGDDAIVVGLLFFFTGLAIIIYLNQYPNQPRERDYSFAGSFQTFAIWIGLSVMAIYQMAEKYLKGSTAYVAAAIGLLAPMLMAVQGWDDHSRAGRYVAPDSAYNLLNSLEKNAVLFTNGDNDTFPLWYLQEVEGVRTDVRVLCLSYVNTDWYIDQMYMDMNESPTLPLTIPRKDYVGQGNQSKGYGAQTQIKKTLTVSTQKLLDQGIISEEELPFVESPMTWTLNTRGPKTSRYLELKDELILNLLENVSKNDWTRPVYFANTVAPSSFLGLDSYLRQEGLAYRILPVKKPRISDQYDSFSGNIDQGRMYEHLVNTFKFRNLNVGGQYYDENIYRMLANYHNTYYRLGTDFLRDIDKLKATNAQLAAVGTDSARAAIQQNEALMLSKAEKARTVMMHAETSFPIEMATPDPYLMARSGLVFQRLADFFKGKDETAAAEMKTQADHYFDYTENLVIESLAYYGDANTNFNQTREYSIAMSLLGSIYQQFGLTDKLQRMQEGSSRINPRLLQTR